MDGWRPGRSDWTGGRRRQPYIQPRLLKQRLCIASPHSSAPPQEVNELKATVEKSKNDVIKTVIGVLGTFSAVVFTATRLLSIAG